MLRILSDPRSVQRLLLCLLIGVGFLPTPIGMATPADTGSNVELVSTLSTIWPRSEPFVVAEQVAFVPAINPSTEQIMGIAVVDLSRPDAPSHTATLPDTFLEKLHTDGSRLFGEKKINTTTYETHVYNLAGTGVPTYAGRSPVRGQVIYSDPQYAVTWRLGDLKAIDLTNPEEGVFPEVGSGYSSPDRLYAVTVSGVLAYAGIDNGLKILSLGSPTVPTEVSTLRFPEPRGAVTDVTVAGGYAYLKSAGGTIVVDVSNPSNPTVAAYGPIPGFTGNIRAVGGVLYTSNSDGLHVYSLADPVAPVEVGYYREESGGDWLQIHAAGTTVYAAVRFNTFSGQAEFRALRVTNVPSLTVQATGPGVMVNGSPLALGNAQSLNDTDVIQGTDEDSQMTLRAYCENLSILVNLLGISRHNDTLFNSNRYDYELAILSRHFTRTCLPSRAGLGARAGTDTLALSLRSGGARFSGTDPELDLTLTSSTATIHSQGANHFVAAQSTNGVTTTVLSRLGTITVTPQNTGLSPVTLKTGEKVDVTASTVSPVTSVPNWEIFLPMAIR
jgi:hypothetical protein